MATSKDNLEEIEFAKNHLLVKSGLDDTCKKQLLKLLNTAAIATNGISLEEKVQKVTEAILGMVIAQMAFLDSIEKRIDTSNKEQCKSCKAMKLANDVEEQKKQEEIINAWKDANGYKDAAKDGQHCTMSVADVLKTILVKPYAWVFASILVFSPYGVQIVNAILSFFSK